MKNILIIICFLFSLNLFAGISIVSDLDDTIKITNSGREVDAARNAFFTDNVFTAMPEFLAAAKLYTNELYILSASPGILRSQINKTLRRNKIEFTSLILKNPIRGQSKLTYKVKQIERLLKESGDDLILIGDDVGQDPEAYQEIQRLYPERVLAVYIHVITNREIPVSGFRYWSTFDLFLKEFLANRMETSWPEKSVELLLTEKKFPMIIPVFANCPKDSSQWNWQTSTIFAPSAQKISDLILAKCKARNSSILADQ